MDRGKEFSKLLVKTIVEGRKLSKADEVKVKRSCVIETKLASHLSKIKDLDQTCHHMPWLEIKEKKLKYIEYVRIFNLINKKNISPL